MMPVCASAAPMGWPLGLATADRREMDPGRGVFMVCSWARRR